MQLRSPIITGIVVSLSLYVLVELLELKLMAGGAALSIFWASIGSNKTRDSGAVAVPFCESEGSLNHIAYIMANYSSPVGSPSYRKVRNVLRNATHFMIDFPDVWGDIFSSVTESLHRLMAGYGLQRTFNVTNRAATRSTIVLELSFYGKDRYAELQETADRRRWRRQRRFILQAEQIQASDAYDGYLRSCHESPACAILEFSDSNLRWGRQRGFADSVLLLPFLIQRRFAGAYPPEIASFHNLTHRNVSVAFFGYIFGRRTVWYNSLGNATFARSMVYSSSESIQEMADTYSSAIVCLVIHSYIADSGGEYHRLSELGPSGCIPVVETVADRVALEAYERCGGLTFAPYDGLAVQVEAVLANESVLHRYEDTMEQRINWWNADIHWETFLRNYFK